MADIDVNELMYQYNPVSNNVFLRSLVQINSGNILLDKCNFDLLVMLSKVGKTNDSAAKVKWLHIKVNNTFYVPCSLYRKLSALHFWANHFTYQN